MNHSCTIRKWFNPGRICITIYIMLHFTSLYFFAVHISVGLYYISEKFTWRGEILNKMASKAPNPYFVTGTHLADWALTRPPKYNPARSPLAGHSTFERRLLFLPLLYVWILLARVSCRESRIRYEHFALKLAHYFACTCSCLFKPLTFSACILLYMQRLVRIVKFSRAPAFKALHAYQKPVHCSVELGTYYRPLYRRLIKSRNACG